MQPNISSNYKGRRIAPQEAMTSSNCIDDSSLTSAAALPPRPSSEACVETARWINFVIHIHLGHSLVPRNTNSMYVCVLDCENLPCEIAPRGTHWSKNQANQKAQKKIQGSDLAPGGGLRQTSHQVISARTPTSDPNDPSDLCNFVSRPMLKTKKEIKERPSASPAS